MSLPSWNSSQLDVSDQKRSHVRPSHPAPTDIGVPFQTVWSAIMSDEKRRATYEDAKMSRAHFHASKIEEILEDVETGKIEPNVARVSIDARKWLAAKMYPKFFSDKVQLQHDVRVDVRKQHLEELRRMTFKPASSCSKTIVF